MFEAFKQLIRSMRYVEATGNHDRLTVGRRLFTKDGRKVGNGIIARAQTHEWGHYIYTVYTDFGNVMKLSLPELDELYHLDHEPEVDPFVDSSLEAWLTDRMRGPAGVRGFVWINRPVVVRGEDFSYEATCLCAFPKTSGKIRYVVEDNGRIFIQREEQLTWV